MIYHGGDTPYVLIYDFGENDSSQHTYTTNFYTDKDSTINIINTNQAEIIGGNNEESCMVYLYSDSGASFSQEKTDTTLALKTTNKAVTHKQATLFITKNADEFQYYIENETLYIKGLNDITFGQHLVDYNEVYLEVPWNFYLKTSNIRFLNVCI